MFLSVVLDSHSDGHPFTAEQSIAETLCRGHISYKPDERNKLSPNLEWTRVSHISFTGEFFSSTNSTTTQLACYDAFLIHNFLQCYSPSIH